MLSDRARQEYWFCVEESVLVHCYAWNCTLCTIRGLSGKFLNMSHKNFPVLPWSYSVMSPSKYFPLLCMHCCQRFFNVLKHSWKAFLGMLHKCASEFVLIASIDSIAFQCWFEVWKQKKKVSWCKIWRVRRLWKDSRRVFGQEVTDKERWMWGRVVMLEHPSILPPHMRSCMPKFSVRISCHTVFEILTFSATSRTVKWRFERMTSQTFATFSSVFDIDGRPERGSSSTEVRPSLKHFHHPYVWVLPMASSLNAIFNISDVSVTDFPIFTQNFTQIRCSWKTLIFLSQENRQMRQTCDHIKKHSTMTKQDRAMRFLRLSLPNSLLESSTCRTPLGWRNGGLFWTFGNFPDSPCTHWQLKCCNILMTVILCA